MQKKIYTNTFKDCSSIISIGFPESILSIDKNAFSGCSSLLSIVGDGISYVNDDAFNGLQNLEYVSFVSNPKKALEYLGKDSFYGTGLTSANLALAKMPNEQCFKNCKKLTNVNMLSSNFMSFKMFENCTSLSSIQFNNGNIAQICSNAFLECSLLPSVALPPQLEYVPSCLFENCSNLKNVVFFGTPNVTYFSQLVFKNANNLTSIEFPQSINNFSMINDYCLSCAPNVSDVFMDGFSDNDLLKSSTHYNLVSLGNNRSASFNELTAFTFSEHYSSFFNNYATYVLCCSTIKNDTILSEDDWNYKKRIALNNYNTLSSILKRSNELSVPVIIGTAIDLSSQLADRIYTQYDMFSHLFNLVKDGESEMIRPIGVKNSCNQYRFVIDRLSANYWLSKSKIQSHLENQDYYRAVFIVISFDIGYVEYSQQIVTAQEDVYDVATMKSFIDKYESQIVGCVNKKLQQISKCTTMRKTDQINSQSSIYFLYHSILNLIGENQLIKSPDYTKYSIAYLLCYNHITQIYSRKLIPTNSNLIKYFNNAEFDIDKGGYYSWQYYSMSMDELYAIQSKPGYETLSSDLYVVNKYSNENVYNFGQYIKTLFSEQCVDALTKTNNDIINRNYTSGDISAIAKENFIKSVYNYFVNDICENKLFGLDHSTRIHTSNGKIISYDNS